jgi:YD repeat-containing protein
MACQATSDRIAGIKLREGKLVKFSWDENDDLVLEDIPDDLMEMTAKIALDRGVSLEDVWRGIVTQWSNERAT